MIDYYKKNIEEMERNALYLYSRLEEKKLGEKTKCPYISSYKAINDETYAIIHTTSGDVRINSSYNPTNEAKIWARQYDVSKSNCTERVLLVFGFGNGYFIRELLEVINESEMVVVYEPDLEMFLYALNNYDLKDILSKENLFLVVEGINQEELESVLSGFGYSIIFGQINMIAIPEFEGLYQERLGWFLQAYQNVYVSSMLSGNTATLNGIKWANASISNIEPILQNDFIEQYEGVLQGKVPVIIVASGPSLSKNMHKLEEAKGKALILAVDSAVKYLNSAGIKPDFLVTLDVKKSLSHFNNDIAINTPMFACTEANPKVIKMNKAKKIFFNDDLDLRRYKKIKKERMNIKGAGSVATAAFEIAKYLGAKTIILIGQDLAFSGNASHAMGERRQDNISTEYTEYIEGNDGTKLKTRYDWYSYLCWYNEQIKLFDGNVVNATEGGAKISGTEIITLEKAIQKYCTVEFDWDSLVKENAISVGIINSEDLISNCIKDLKQQLKEVEECIPKAFKLINKLLEENKRNVIENYSMKKNSAMLSEINQEISAKEVNKLIEKYTYETTMTEYKDLFVKYEDKQKNRKHIYEKSKKVYEAIQDACTMLIEQFDKYKENINVD